jgi:quercetin dioxygenase-like cupin family protein
MLLVVANGAAVLGQQGEGFAISACDEDGPAAESAFAAQLPPGVALRVLADEATEAWPPFARGLVMTVRHLTLDPDVASATRQSQGPVLFYVESGTLDVSVNGQPRIVEQGATLLIERSENYQLRNEDASAPATLLRVQIVPPGGETKVARGDIAMAMDDEQALSPGPPFIQSQLLLTADVPAVDGLTHLVLGCLSWADGAPDAGETVHAGPVALLVLDGEMLVGETGSLAAGQCTVFNGNVAHRLRAGSPPPSVLLIGILPDGKPFWAEPAGTGPPPGRLAFSCDPDAAPDAVPDAAQRAPAGDSSWASA